MRLVIQGVTISNDGATIMRLLDIVHPAAKTLVNISMSQDAEVSCTHNKSHHLLLLLSFFSEPLSNVMSILSFRLPVHLLQLPTAPQTSIACY